MSTKSMIETVHHLRIIKDHDYPAVTLCMDASKVEYGQIRFPPLPRGPLICTGVHDWHPLRRSNNLGRLVYGLELNKRAAFVKY